MILITFMPRFLSELYHSNKILYLTKGHHTSLVSISFLFLLVSTLELIGTGAVGPFIAIATNPDSIGTNPWFKFAYDRFNFSSEGNFTFAVGSLVIAAFYAKSYLSFESQKAVFRFGYELKASLSCNLLKAYINAPYSFHLKNNSANLVQNIISTTDNVCIGVIMPLLTTISNAVIILALVILLVKTSALALVSIAILLPISVGLISLLKSRLAVWNESGWKAYGEMIKIFNHGLGGLKETRVIGCESFFDRQMSMQAQNYAKNLTLSQAYGNLPRYVIEAFMITFLVGFTLLFINFNSRQGENLSSVLGIFAIASIRLLPAISNLVGNINTYKANTFAVDKLFFDLREVQQGEILPSFTNGESLDGLTGKKMNLFLKDRISLEGISFEYPNTSKLALNEIHLNIKSGSSIGIIGKSGSGKTTLVDVLLGLFIPQAGDIKVDGISIYSNLRAWQNLVGYVPQSIFLIDDTLERNIAFGLPDNLIDRHRLQQAIEMAQLTEVVEQLPQGIHTIVGERGVLLSGGQRQRVGIARVLYHQREILVFDEATAALDNETEHLVTEATKALSGNKTIIIIAHRLSTIEHCDCIYQIDRGRIIKSGSYKEVILDQ